MKIREVLSICAAVISLGTVMVMMNKELNDSDGDGRADGIAPTEAQATNSAGQQDPLLGIDYIQANREENFVAFGLGEDMVRATMKVIKRLDTRTNRSTLKAILESSAGDRAFLQAALCGATNDQRPRYGALQLLVEAKDGDRFVMDLSSLQGSLRAQDWAGASPWSEVYRKVELVGDRREENATMMGIAAIILAEEESVLDVIEPWGSQGSSEWTWKMVKEDHPGIALELNKYFALFHLVAELAHQDGGICQD
jgi:hypothetical protein